MINLEVQNSTDPDRLGSFLFYKDLIYVGANHDADLFIPEDGLKSNHIFLEVIESKLLAHLGRDTKFILINGKRTTSFKTLKIGDTVSINSLTFKVINYTAVENSSPSDFLKKRVAMAKESEPELMELLKTFGDEI